MEVGGDLLRGDLLEAVAIEGSFYYGLQKVVASCSVLQEA